MNPITFKYRRRDYIGALRYLFAKSLLSPRSLLTFTLVIAMLAYFMHDDRTSYLMSLLQGFILLSSIIGVVGFLLQPYMVARRTGALSSEHTITFTEQVVSITNQLIDLKLKWDAFNHFIQNKTSYILRGKSNFLIIPKSAFPDEEAHSQFQSFIKSKLG